MWISRKKSRRRPTSTRQPGAFKNMGVYIYNIIYICLQKKWHMSPYEISLFYRNLKKWLFPKKLDFDEKNQVNFKKMMKTKMVRMVHRNILYEVDLEICDSKSWIWRKSKKWRFLKWSLKKWKWRFWDSKWGLLGCFQRQKYFKIYSGPIRHHPGSIFIYKIIFLNKNHWKSAKIKKNR